MGGRLAGKVALITGTGSGQGRAAEPRADPPREDAGSRELPERKKDL
jgi:hypothetical protein